MGNTCWVAACVVVDVCDSPGMDKTRQNEGAHIRVSTVLQHLVHITQHAHFTLRSHVTLSRHARKVLYRHSRHMADHTAPGAKGNPMMQPDTYARPRAHTHTQQRTHSHNAHAHTRTHTNDLPVRILTVTGSGLPTTTPCTNLARDRGLRSMTAPSPRLDAS